jgi:hypothetical protein
MAALTSPSQHTTKEAQKNTRKLWHEMKYMKAVNSARTLVMVKAASHVDTFFSILWTATITSIQNPPLPIRQTTFFQALKIEFPSQTVSKNKFIDGYFFNHVASQQQSEHIQTCVCVCVCACVMQERDPHGDSLILIFGHTALAKEKFQEFIRLCVSRWDNIGAR